VAFVKLHTDILGDAKLLRAARKGAGALFLLPWLLAFAKDADDDGRLTVNGEAAELDDIAPKIPCATKKMVGQCLSELEEIGVLIRDGEVLRFARWDARAGKDSDSRDATRNRKRAQREREKSRDVTRDMSVDVTRNGHAVEKEKEKEKEKEQESASVTSCGVTFDHAWSEYPRRSGTNSRHDAEKAWDARIREGEDPQRMLDGTLRYRRYCDAQSSTGTQFVMQGTRFYGASKHYVESWEHANAMPPMYEADGVTYTSAFLAWSDRTKVAG
jgi:DNA-directed RNA polymerase subunit N (RpoN/RPB10)